MKWRSGGMEVGRAVDRRVTSEERRLRVLEGDSYRLRVTV
jgi:hypothetical protein